MPVFEYEQAALQDDDDDIDISEILYGVNSTRPSMPSPRNKKESDSKSNEEKRRKEMKYQDDNRRENREDNEDLLKKIFERLDADRVKARQEMKEQMRELEQRIIDKIQNTIEEKF